MTRERCKPNTQEVFMDIIAQHKHMHGPLDQDKDIHKVRQTGSKTNTHTDIKGKTPNPSEAFMEGKTQMFYKCASNILKYSMKEHTIPFRISFCRLGKKEQFAACCRHQGYDTGASEMPWLLTLRTRNLRERCPEAGHLCPIWDELANEKAPWGDEVAGWQRAQVGQWVVGGEHYGGLLGPLGTNRPPGNCWGLQSCQSTNSHLNTSLFPPAYLYPLTIFS